MKSLQIIDSAYYVPEQKFSSQDIETKIRQTWLDFSHWILERLTWVKTRYHRNENEFPSTLASEACKKLIQRNKEKIIDLLIFASTSRDVYEPATSNIVQYYSWLSCPAFDVSNACNSYLTWLSIANSFIKSGLYKNIILCTWETPSIAIDWKTSNKKDLIAWTTLWDAWAAMLLWPTKNDDIWMKYEFFLNKWEFWEDITVKWWGARFPRSPEETYFKSDLDSSIWYFKENWLTPLIEWLKISWWNLEDIDKIFFHQASKMILSQLIKTSKFPIEKVYSTFENYWNTASVSIPLWFAIEQEKWNIKPWEKIVFICPAAWLSYWIIFIQT